MSDINPAGITTPGLRAIPDELTDDVDEVPSDAPVAKSDREGLPPSYRMRADAHYVDQLTSRRAEPGRPRVEVDPGIEAERRELRERRTADLMSHVLDQVTSIESAAVQLRGERSALARRACVDIVSAEAWRAAWMLRAVRLVDGAHVYRARPRPIGPVLAEVRDRLTPEFRLGGAHLHVIASDWSATAEVDDAAFVTAVTGAVRSMMALVEDTAGASIRVTVKTVSGDLQSIEVSQDEATIGDAMVRRFFDVTWTERPGGWVAGLGAAAARAFASLSGGEATVTGGRRGSTLRLDFERPF